MAKRPREIADQEAKCGAKSKRVCGQNSWFILEMQIGGREA